MGPRNLHIENSQIIKAPRERVFQILTDYETWPKFSTFFSRVSVTERNGNIVRLDTDVKLRGRKVRRMEKHVQTPPARIEVEGEMEGVTNTSVWKFDSVPEGTCLTASVDAQLNGWARLLGPIAKRQLSSLLRKEMQAYAKYIEAK